MNHFRKTLFALFFLAFAFFAANEFDVMGNHIVQSNSNVFIKIVEKNDNKEVLTEGSSFCPKKKFDSLVNRRHSMVTYAFDRFCPETFTLSSTSFFEKIKLVSIHGFDNKCQSCCYDFLFRFCLF